ncbi:2715_t:CDS:1 [Acaulospora morrowiae]|uniref:2715_t:CDS:1 n=1 Tax=Acaulospora morrowiae TaxID=94023 RepID=A0A9N9HZB3_9GLOM|nr:2715_t:CDS:1 [Acaulospora morrowiae]
MNQLFSKSSLSISPKSNVEDTVGSKSGRQIAPLSCSPSSISIPPNVSDPILDHPSILHRQPTFSYVPIHKRRRSGGYSPSSMFLRSISSLSISSTPPQFTDSNSDCSWTPASSDNELTMPTTPTSSVFTPLDDDSMEYTSFPNLEKFSDESWTEIRIEKCDPDEIQMESYDEMCVGGVRFQYS